MLEFLKSEWGSVDARRAAPLGWLATAVIAVVLVLTVAQVASADVLWCNGCYLQEGECKVYGCIFTSPDCPTRAYKKLQVHNPPTGGECQYSYWCSNECNPACGSCW